MAYQGVTLKGVTPDNDLTFILNNDIVEENVGLVVTQDSSAANTVKLAGDGDEILGRLESYEDRTATAGYKVGTVKLVGGMELKTAEGYSAKVGDKVAGAEGGFVKKADNSNVTVWEVRSDSVIVIKNS
jgi:hypothetical protein